ncbi:MAG TPA: GspH/FimT family protein, partial [Nitrospiria bacterium]|nr:GspH/FimT family protein [Nitrospiria bacterium]
ALPNLATRFSHDRLNRSAQQLASDLRWARQLAITSHLRTHLRFISEETYLIEKEDPITGWAAAAPPAELYPGIRLLRGGMPQFDPKGVVVPTASFVLEGRGESRMVIVSMTGRVRIG